MLSTKGLTSIKTKTDMKKTVLFLLGMLMITSASAAENYFPLVKDGRKWIYLYYKQVGYSTEIIPLYLYSFEIRDENQVYYTLLDKNLTPINEPQPEALLFEDPTKAGRVIRVPFSEAYPSLTESDYDLSAFWYSPETHFYDIYNFSLEGYLPAIDEGVSPYYWEFYTSRFRNIDEKTTVMVDGEMHNAYVLNTSTGESEYEFFYGCKIIEGIGVDSRSGDLLSPQIGSPTYHLFDVELPGLVAVYDGDELIYKGCLYDEAMEFSAITTVAGDRQIKGVRYYNLAGVESAEPQQGVNIKVTTYSDGTRTSEKVLK